MKLLSLFLTALALSPFQIVSADTIYYDGQSDRVALTLEGGDVYGSWMRQLGEGNPWIQGYLSGKVSAEKAKGTVEWTSEGAEGSEQFLFKLEGETLLIGEGRVVFGEGGERKFANPEAITFTRTLTRVRTVNPKPGTEERKAIMDSMRGPVSAYAGGRVQFTGEVTIAGNWARFSGSAARADGKKPSNPDVASEMDLDFFALLKKDTQAGWQTLHWGFAGDIGVMEEASKKFPQAPWVLLH